MGEFSPQAEAGRLMSDALARFEELIGDDEETELTIALQRAAWEAERRAEERSRALAEFRRTMRDLLGYATSAAERGDLELLRERLAELANGAADAVLKEWEEARAQVQSMNNTREWERSPVGRGATRT